MARDVTPSYYLRSFQVYYPSPQEVGDEIESKVGPEFPDDGLKSIRPVRSAEGSGNNSQA